MNEQERQVATAERREPAIELQVARRLVKSRCTSAATIPADKQLYQRQIEATDRQIDALVYELYGLTGEEIEIVEGTTR